MNYETETATEAAATARGCGVPQSMQIFYESSIPESVRESKKHLNTIDGATLMTAPLPPIRFVALELLPQGLHILAGAPKVGKSWLVLWLCLRIAKGEALWSFPVTKGDVLYLCLEDSYSRIQNRLLDITDDAPDNLFFASMSEKLRCGLELQIESFLAEHPDTVLIVIDTLQRIRCIANDLNPYANDYRDLGILKELADKHRIAILLIHHLRKMNDDDPMNMISGTTGISGAADSSFVLRKDKRGGNTATLYCTGRDIEYRELSLEFDSDTHIWNLLSDSVTAKPESGEHIIFTLSEFMKEQFSFTGTATELADALEAHSGEKPLPNMLMKKIIRYREELNRHGVVFESSRTRDRRELQITYVGDGSDGNDGKNDTGPVSNLPSQPSQLSREDR